MVFKLLLLILSLTNVLWFKVYASDNVVVYNHYLCRQFGSEVLKHFDINNIEAKKDEALLFDVAVSPVGVLDFAHFMPWDYNLVNGSIATSDVNKSGFDVLCRQAGIDCFRPMQQQSVGLEWDLFVTQQRYKAAGIFAVAINTKELYKVGICFSRYNLLTLSEKMEQELINVFVRDLSFHSDQLLQQKADILMQERQQMADKFNQMYWYEQDRLVEATILGMAAAGFLSTCGAKMTMLGKFFSRASLPLWLMAYASQAGATESLEFYLTKNGTSYWLNADDSSASWVLSAHPQLISYFDKLSHSL